MGAAEWSGIISVIFTILSFYFTLSFIENLKKDDKRIIKQSKIAAIISLGTALFVPLLANLIYY